ncbi:hypothetical protein ASC64_17235 [Nocardioides sp. Root122]|uniref:hypothetical protein n=1 Tax=Nocardioides TaxID=1839 RepID=UPI000702B81B|nr:MULTISPECIES: hypothetical protein [Nocardioides]KQV63340.1 hypothetical protein ASC64_17235 [Nocardioides sp. Root122]MCK9825562.1 hypothetical protein [Nocardioides cavernae]
MTTHPDQDLSTTLRRIADSTDPLPVADDLWRRGQRARRRGRVLAVAAVLAVLASVGGVVTLVSADREVRTASTEVVEGGAIPSRIEDPGELTLEPDLEIGRASVAFFSETGQAVVVGADDGRYHALDLPDLSRDLGPLALSPDGRHLAWSSHGRIHSADLDDGSQTYYPSHPEHASVIALRWAPDSSQLLWNGTNEDGEKSGGVLPAGDYIGGPLLPSALRGIPSPTNQLVATSSSLPSDAARFVRRRGRVVERHLPEDLYPSGAAVTPVGWAADHLVVAQAYGPPGSYVEGQHLVLFTSPDRPESEWTYRILLRDIPQNAVPLSIAVDLVPDLDGTSSQQLTHDFGDTLAPDQRDISWLIGLGVAAAIAVLLGLRWLWRRFLG